MELALKVAESSEPSRPVRVQRYTVVAEHSRSTEVEPASPLEAEKQLETKEDPVCHAEAVPRLER